MFHHCFLAQYNSYVSCSVCFRQPTAAKPCSSVVLCPSQTATGLTDRHCRLPFFLDRANNATPVPARLLHLSSHPTVLSHSRYLVHNHPHIPCHAESRRFPFRAVAEPVRLSLCVLPGPQWLGVLPSTLVSALVEELPLPYSFATDHFRLGVSCIVPGTSCRSTARNTMQAPVSTLR